MVTHSRLTTAVRASVSLALCAGIALGSADTASADGLPLGLPLPLPSLPLPPLPSLPLPSLPSLPLPSLPSVPLPSVSSLPLPSLPPLTLPALPPIGLPSLPIELPVLPGIPVPGLTPPPSGTPGLPTELPVQQGVPVPGPAAPVAPGTGDVSGLNNQNLDIGHGSGLTGSGGSLFTAGSGGSQSWAPYPGQMSAYDDAAVPAASAGVGGAKVGKSLVAEPLGDGDSSPILPILVAAGLAGLCGLLLSARRAWTRSHMLTFSPE